jgi:hypothetical protein
MPGWDVNIDDAYGRIPEHIAVKGLALDRDPADGTYRPEELAHASYPWLLLILPAFHQALRLFER